ncbi:MAG TPA: hypothetical protein VI585_26710 [Candidatus Binatia bacterium]
MSINRLETDLDPFARLTGLLLSLGVRAQSFDLRLCCEIHPTTEE